MVSDGSIRLSLSAATEDSDEIRVVLKADLPSPGMKSQSGGVKDLLSVSADLANKSCETHAVGALVKERAQEASDPGGFLI